MQPHGFYPPFRRTERNPTLSESTRYEAREMTARDRYIFPDEAIARVIAGHWHGGGGSYMYSYASMGRLCPYTAEQIWTEVAPEFDRTDFEEATDKAELQFLHDYLFTYHR